MPSSGGEIVETVLLCVMVVILLGAPLFGGAVIRSVRRRIETRRDRRPQPAPSGPSTGQLVDDLRRLSRLQAELPAGAPWARQHGTQLAFDDVLAKLCRALDVEHELDSLPMGLTRDLERLRVEEVIHGLGLRIHPVGT